MAAADSGKDSGKVGTVVSTLLCSGLVSSRGERVGRAAMPSSWIAPAGREQVVPAHERGICA
jgi:hypothetical protein